MRYCFGLIFGLLRQRNYPFKCVHTYIFLIFAYILSCVIFCYICYLKLRWQSIPLTLILFYYSFKCKFCRFSIFYFICFKSPSINAFDIFLEYANLSILVANILNFGNTLGKAITVNRS